MHIVLTQYMRQFNTAQRLM